MAINKRKLEGAILMGIGIVMLVGLLFAYVLMTRKFAVVRADFETIHLRVTQVPLSEGQKQYVDFAHRQSLISFDLAASLMKTLLIVSGITSLMIFWFGQELRVSVRIDKDAGSASPETASAE